MAMTERERPRPQAMVCVGAVTGARGLKGDVRIKSFTADPGDVAAYGPVTDETGERSFGIRVTGRSKDQLIARIDGIEDRDAAEALKGTELYVPRSALPETEAGTYYHADLVGLGVETGGGRALGRIKAVHNFGAGDVIEVVADEGRGVMVPFNDRVVTAVDLKNRRVVIEPPKGLLDGGDDDGGGPAETDKD